jgi:hypothetical protein
MKIYLWSKKKDCWKPYNIKDFDDKRLKKRNIYIGNNAHIKDHSIITEDINYGK